MNLFRFGLTNTAASSTTAASAAATLACCGAGVGGATAAEEADDAGASNAGEREVGTEGGGRDEGVGAGVDGTLAAAALVGRRLKAKSEREAESGFAGTETGC